MSVIIPECWENAIGITRQTCECVDYTNVPVDYDVSLSGLYVDELKGINVLLLDKAGDCTDTWEKITRAMQNAINTVKADLVREIMRYNRLRFSAFSGNIGGAKYNATITPTKVLAGLRMFCNDIKDGYFILEDIGAIMSTNCTVNGKVYGSEDYTTPITTWQIDAVANRVTWAGITTPVELPLFSQYVDNLEYFFTYDTPGILPRNNRLTCGCGGVKWCFDPHRPCWAQPGVQKDAWRQFAMVGGVQTNDLSDEDDRTTSQYGNGLILKGQFVCNPTSLICNDDNDWANDPVSNAVAYALWYKTGEYLVDDILSSDKINRYTMMNREGLENNRAYYQERYAVMCEYIGGNIDITRTGCVECYDRYNLRRVGILS